MLKSLARGLLVCVLVALTTPVLAAVTVTGENVDSVTVEIEEAPVSIVLENLRERFGFELDGTEKAAGGEPLTLTLSGSLKEIVGRLLRNWNYVIVSSPDGGNGIAKVVILNAAYGTSPPAAAGTATKDPQLNQITGE
jgi:hypothetical protein